MKYVYQRPTKRKRKIESLYNRLNSQDNNFLLALSFQTNIRTKGLSLSTNKKSNKNLVL